jgi:hypothetical protein
MNSRYSSAILSPNIPPAAIGIGCAVPKLDCMKLNGSPAIGWTAVSGGLGCCPKPPGKKVFRLLGPESVSEMLPDVVPGIWKLCRGRNDDAVLGVI